MYLKSLHKRGRIISAKVEFHFIFVLYFLSYTIIFFHCIRKIEQNVEMKKDSFQRKIYEGIFLDNRVQAPTFFLHFVLPPPPPKNGNCNGTS